MKALFKAKNVSLDKDAKRQLGALTFSECNTFAAELASARSATAVKSLLREAWSGCTLNTKAGDNETWEAKCKSEEKFNT
jgi:hypothetical protein